MQTFDLPLDKTANFKARFVNAAGEVVETKGSVAYAITGDVDVARIDDGLFGFQRIVPLKIGTIKLSAEVVGETPKLEATINVTPRTIVGGEFIFNVA